MVPSSARRGGSMVSRSFPAQEARRKSDAGRAGLPLVAFSGTQVKLLSLWRHPCCCSKVPKLRLRVAAIALALATYGCGAAPPPKSVVTATPNVTSVTTDESFADIAIPSGLETDWRAETFSASQAKPWIANGFFRPDEVSLWIKCGFPDPATAAKSKKLISYDYIPERADYLAADMKAPSRAKQYVDAGLSYQRVASLNGQGADVRNADQTILLESLLTHGYTFKSGLFYARSGVPLSGIKAFQRVENTIAHVCQNHLHRQMELIGSPYTNVGKCYVISGTVVQWLGPSAAMLGGHMFQPLPVSGRVQLSALRHSGRQFARQRRGRIFIYQRLRRG